MGVGPSTYADPGPSTFLKSSQSQYHMNIAPSQDLVSLGDSHLEMGSEVAGQDQGSHDVSHQLRDRPL